MGRGWGNLDNDGERVTLKDKNGVVVCTGEIRDGGNWPASTDGAGHTLVLRNENQGVDDFRNWRVSQYAGGTPGSAEFAAVEAFAGSPEIGSGTAVQVVGYGDVWKFTQPASDPGTSWKDLIFDDSTWNSGPGLIGFEGAPLPPPGIQSPFGASGPIPYLFRKVLPFRAIRWGPRSFWIRSLTMARRTI